MPLSCGLPSPPCLHTKAPPGAAPCSPSGLRLGSAPGAECAEDPPQGAERHHPANAAVGAVRAHTHAHTCAHSRGRQQDKQCPAEALCSLAIIRNHHGNPCRSPALFSHRGTAAPAPPRLQVLGLLSASGHLTKCRAVSRVCAQDVTGGKKPGKSPRTPQKSERSNTLPDPRVSPAAEAGHSGAAVCTGHRGTRSGPGGCRGGRVHRAGDKLTPRPQRARRAASRGQNALVLGGQGSAPLPAARAADPGPRHRAEVPEVRSWPEPGHLCPVQPACSPSGRPPATFLRRPAGWFLVLMQFVSF